MQAVTFDRALPTLQKLAPLQQFLDDPNNTEICVNKPGQVVTETREGWRYHDVPELTFTHCKHLASMIASYSNQKLDEETPILSATLPNGERIQIAIPPASLENTVTFTIRRPSSLTFTLDDYERQGAFDQCKEFSKEISTDEMELVALKKNRKYKEFLELAVKTRKNIIVSGSTGSGKTTFMKSLLSIVPDNERLISIENVDELALYKTHSNTVSLFYSAGGQGVSKIDQQQLLESSLRMKPDRIFVAELIRGDEAFYYLRNVNSGHPGSITSMHANSAKLAIEQLVLFLKESKSGSSMTRDDIKQLLFMCVDIIIQINVQNGKRIISEIYYDPEFKRQQMA